VHFISLYCIITLQRTLQTDTKIVQKPFHGKAKTGGRSNV